ncbi:MAG: hypothetical protein P8Y75_13520 [Nitrospirota bacterium]
MSGRSHSIQVPAKYLSPKGHAAIPRSIRAKNPMYRSMKTDASACFPWPVSL